MEQSETKVILTKLHIDVNKALSIQKTTAEKGQLHVLVIYSLQLSLTLAQWIEQCTRITCASCMRTFFSQHGLCGLPVNTTVSIATCVFRTFQPSMMCFQLWVLPA